MPSTSVHVQRLILYSGWLANAVEFCHEIFPMQIVNSIGCLGVECIRTIIVISGSFAINVLFYGLDREVLRTPYLIVDVLYRWW